MAGLMVHALCGREIPDDLYLCPHCAQAVDHDAAATVSYAQDEPVAAPAPAPAAAPAGTTCSLCNAPLSRLDLPCDICGTLPAAPDPAVAPAPAAERAPGPVASVALRLPSGVEIVVSRGTTVVLGRQTPDARVNAAFEPYTAVSRRHASITLADDQVSVTDHGSTNGTFLDGVPARPTLSARADRTSTLGLGTEVQISVSPLS